eukprot:3031723-Rhodomonas_salina.1
MPAMRRMSAWVCWRGCAQRCHVCSQRCNLRHAVHQCIIDTTPREIGGLSAALKRMSGGAVGGGSAGGLSSQGAGQHPTSLRAPYAKS